jgi:NTE family protein
LNLTQKKSLFKNDVISADFILGDNFRYNLDYYIDNGFYFSFGIKSRLNRFNRNVASDFNNGTLFNQLDISTLNVDFLDLDNRAFVQTIFAQKFLIGAGLDWKYLRIKSNTLNNSSSVFEDSDYASVFGFFKYDSFDNKYFPKKGWDFNSEINSYLYSSDYSKQFNRFSIVSGEASFAQTAFKKATFKFQTEIGFTMGQKSAPYLNFVLGGYGFNAINNFKPFYGYDFVSLSGDSYLKTDATIDVEIYKKNHLNFSANYALVEDDLFERVDWISREKRTGYALGYGLETFIGPIEFKYSWSPEVKQNFFWLSLGFWF